MGRGLHLWPVQDALATENNKRVAARRPICTRRVFIQNAGGSGVQASKIDAVEREGSRSHGRSEASKATACGSCVHLGPEGCTVHALRPRGCQTYDCRLFSLLGIVETAVPVPHWTFSARTREQKAVLFALHMTVVEHSRSRRVTHEVLQDIIAGYEEHLPFAREMVTNMERMTTAEREAFIASNLSRDSKKLELFPRWDRR